MISLMCSNSGSFMASLIFYTCVWIPFLQFKKLVLTLLGFVFPWYRPEQNCPAIDISLPVARFEDLKLSHGGCGGGYNNNNGELAEDEVCSICLVEFVNEDVVSQIKKCRHVFHMNCIENWMERDHFTCPLCRAFLFEDIICSRSKRGDIATNTSSHLVSSWLSF